MEFKRLPRSCRIENGWRLATVEEAQRNLDSIRHLLEMWDRARLLDGWIGGSAYAFHAEMGFRSCVGYMLVRSISDDGVKYRYSGVALSDEGKRAALFLCTEDWNYEVVRWLLECWSEGKIKQLLAWGLVETEELLSASKGVSALARELQIMPVLDKQSRRPFSVTSMIAVMTAILKFLMYKTHNDYLLKALSEIKPTVLAEKIWNEMHLTEDMAKFQTLVFNTTAEGTREGFVDIVWHVAVDAMAVSIVRHIVLRPDLASATDIFANANHLLNRAFFREGGLWRILREAADTAKGDLESFKEILRDQGYGTFSSNGRYSFLNTILVVAAKKGNVDLVETLLKCGVQPLETDDTKSKTALHHAAKFKNETDGYRMAEKLLSEPTGEMLANVPDYKHRTPLHRAAVCGHARMCELLINHKSSVSAKDRDGQTPLHSALSRKQQNESAIHVFISAHSSVEAEDSSRRTPLDYAVEYQGDNANMMRLLLSQSKQPVEPYLKKLKLSSYLREASQRGHLDLVKMLLSMGANPFYGDKLERKTALHYAVEGNGDQQALDIIHELVLDKYRQVSKFELARAYDKYGRSVLHAAAFAGHKKLCEWLVSLDVMDVDAKDHEGRNALYHAVGGKHDDAQLLDVWRRRRASTQAVNIVDLKDVKETTPLHVAAANGNFRMVEKILSQIKASDRKMVVRAADVLGQTALHKAASGGHIQVVKILLTEGAHPLEERDCDGKTALHHAVQSGNGDNAMAIAKQLLNSCHPDKEKFHLLCASAVATGFAEETVGLNSSLKEYLVGEKNRISGAEKENLLRAAAVLGIAELGKELLRMGFDIDHIRCPEWRASLLPPADRNVTDVLHQIDNINYFVERSTDKPALEDNLGRSPFVNGLALLFLNPFVESPITVGISGAWGMGKSSVMLQLESILLTKAAQSAFSSSLKKEEFPPTSDSKPFGHGEPKSKTIIGKVENLVKGLYYKTKSLIKGFCVTKENNIKKCHAKELRDILVIYNPKNHKVFKSLAVAERREMIPAEEGSQSDDRKQGIIPSILTVRYNAWQYRSQSEAWAGLGVEIMKELEAAMTVAQRLGSSWRYNWATRKRSIYVEVILPSFLAITVAVWVTVILWFVLDKTKAKNLNDFKFASLPITLIAVTWATVNSVMSVVKPISSQVADYLCLPDHSQKLGYHQKVIDDINFLKDELSHKPSWLSNFFALVWCWSTFSWEEKFVPGTMVPKMTPASKDHLRMVVFVDDLDRCQENVIIQILSAINLVLSVCEINVVMAMDKSMIERAIAKTLGDKKNESDKDGLDLADKYLRKIIQLPLDLPDPSLSDSKRFLHNQLGVIEKTVTDADEETEKQSGRHAARKIKSKSPEWTLLSQRSLDQFHQKLWRPREKLEIKKRKDNNSGTDISREGINSNSSDQKEQKDTIGKSGDMISNAQGDQSWTQVTGSRKLPREWKRLLYYHRLAWNILYTSNEVKTLEGWQVQLIAWIFICWQWKDPMNTLIEGWPKHSAFGNKNPSLKDIVEHYIDEKWPAQKTGSLVHGDVKDTINRTIKKKGYNKRGLSNRSYKKGLEREEEAGTKEFD